MAEYQSMYLLEQRLIAIENAAEQIDDDESAIILEQARAEIESDIESKLESYLGWRGELRARVEYLKQEKKRLDDKIKKAEKRIDYIERVTGEWMNRQGYNKTQVGTYDLSWRNSVSIEVLEGIDEFIPDSLCNIKRTPDKTAIKKLMGDNDTFSIDVDGHSIKIAKKQVNENLQIK